MGWIDIKDKMPPEGLQVLLEVSGLGRGEHGETVHADHTFYLGCWIVSDMPDDDGHWLLYSKSEIYDPTVHAWMPLPRHYQKQQIFTQEPDLMEHAMFEDDPDWLYKGNCVYEQMSLEDFMRGAS